MSEKVKGASRMISEAIIESGRFLKLSDKEAAELFTPSKDHLPYLLCRQIVRDLGEATNRRGCGIYATIQDETTFMIITLPSVWKISK